MKKMQCKKLFLCCGISMLALFGLYGCTTKNGTNSDNTNTGTVNAGENAAGNTGTANTTTGTTTNGTTAAGTAADGNTVNTDTANKNTTDGTTNNSSTHTGSEKVEKNVQTEYTIGDVKNLEKVKLDHEDGNVTIGVSTDEHIKIKANSKITAYSQAEWDKIAENIDIISKVVGNKCILKVVHKSEGTEFWDWLEKEQKEKNVTMDLEILLPKNFLSFDISADAGTIHFAGLEGTLDLETDDGDIKVDLVDNFSKGSRMELEADNGNIEINLKNNPIEYTRNEKNNVKAKINGVCDLEAASDNGSVTVTK